MAWQTVMNKPKIRSLPVVASKVLEVIVNDREFALSGKLEKEFRDAIKAAEQTNTPERSIDPRIVKHLENPNSCPHCGSEDIVTEGPDCHGNEAIWDITCNGCQKEWREIFILNRIVEMDGSSIRLENEVAKMK